MLKDKTTFEDILKAKGKEKIVAITAYDAMFAKIFDNFVDIVLVDNSLNMSFSGKEGDISLSLDEMIYHTKAVKRATKKALVVFDMPFGTYNDEKTALKNVIKACKKADVDAVKIQIDMGKMSIIKALSDNGINVMAHLGSLTHKLNEQEKTKEFNDIYKKNLIKEAKMASLNGAFCILLDDVSIDVANEITKSLNIPVISFGSSNLLDGELLVFSDMLGFTDIYKNKATKTYLNAKKLIEQALNNFVKDVKNEDKS